MKAQAKTNSYPVSSFLQKSFIIIFLAGILLSVTEILSWIIRQYPTNHNLSSYLLISVQILIVPIIMFLAAYFSGSRKGTKQARIFEASLLSLMGTLIVGIVSEISLLPFTQFIGHGYSYWSSIFYSLCTTGIGVLLFLIGLLYYRKKS